MVTSRRKHQRDVAFAVAIIERIQDPRVIQPLKQHYPHNLQSLLEQLTKLNADFNSIEIAELVVILQQQAQLCGQYSALTPSEREVVHSLLMDAYTFSRTSDLIESLTGHIPVPNQAFYQPDPLEVYAAKELRSACEQIRNLIGSPEAMAKGSIIEFVVHLYQAAHNCQEISKPKLKNELMAAIQSEINSVQKWYPELANAGKDLYEAIANYHFQKP